jgi:ABC-type glycerol-3-phosphate transport system substrate-binding protein
MTRRKFVAGASLSGVALAACNPQAGAPTKKERTTPYSVRFMALGSNPWMLEQLELFNREIGPALKVQVAPEPQPNQADLWTKFQATLAGGDAPDVARLKEIWVFEAAAKGAMAGLDGYFKTDKDFNAADLLPLYQENFKYKGVNYAVAREVSVIVGYYNKAHFSAAGLDPEKPPATYDQFREYARRLTKPGATPQDSQWGFQVYEYGTREFVLLWLYLHMRRFGAEFWNKDRTAVVLNTPVHVEVLQYFMDMAHKDRSTIPPNVTVQQSVATGKVSMWEQGTWQIPLYPRQAPDLNFGAFIWPKKVNQAHIPLAGSSAVTKASKDLDATWEFVKWWNTPENQIGWYLNAGGNGPSRRSLYNQPPISNDPQWKSIIPLVTVGNSQPRPMAERYTELAETMTPSLMKGFNNQVTAKEALDEASRIGSAFWKDIGGNASKSL